MVVFMNFLSLIFTTDPGRVRVAVRLRPKNDEDVLSDDDFSDCVELQPEVIYMFHHIRINTNVEYFYYTPTHQYVSSF